MRRTAVAPRARRSAVHARLASAVERRPVHVRARIEQRKLASGVSTSAAEHRVGRDDEQRRETHPGMRWRRPTIAPMSWFTGKEEDVEVGLEYFGKRYLNPLLGRWVNPDPLALHDAGQADLNLYAYVRGMALKATDPFGLAEDEQKGISFVAPGADANDSSSQNQSASYSSAAPENASTEAPKDPTAYAPHEERHRLERYDRPLERPLVDPIDLADPNLPAMAMAIAPKVGVKAAVGLGVKALVREGVEEASKVGERLVAEQALPETAQRALLRSRLGGEVGDGMVAHHVVPLESLTRAPDTMAKAARGGFDINGTSNGLLMDAANHVGGHPQYNETMIDQIRKIPANWSPEQVAARMQKIADTAAEAIKKGTWGPWQ
jgi:RHS repeat-associated protein